MRLVHVLRLRIGYLFHDVVLIDILAAIDFLLFQHFLVLVLLFQFALVQIPLLDLLQDLFDDGGNLGVV